MSCKFVVGPAIWCDACQDPALRFWIHQTARSVDGIYDYSPDSNFSHRSRAEDNLSPSIPSAINTSGRIGSNFPFQKTQAAVLRLRDRSRIELWSPSHSSQSIITHPDNVFQCGSSHARRRPGPGLVHVNVVMAPSTIQHRVCRLTIPYLTGRQTHPLSSTVVLVMHRFQWRATRRPSLSGAGVLKRNCRRQSSGPAKVILTADLERLSGG